MVNKFNELIQQLEDRLGTSNLKDRFQRELTEIQNLRKEVFEKVKQEIQDLSSSDIESSKVEELLFLKLKDSRFGLITEIREHKQIVVLSFLKSVLDFDEFFRQLVFEFYYDQFWGLRSLTTEKIIEDIRQIALKFYTSEAYIHFFSLAFNLKNTPANAHFIDLEYNLLDDFIENYVSLKKSNSKLHNLINKTYKDIDTERDEKRLLSEEKNKIESENFDLNFEKTKLDYEVNYLTEQVQLLTLSKDQFFEAYIFGDYLMVYEKIYQLLAEYKVITETPFSLFCLVLQEIVEPKYSIELNTSNDFTIELIGYLFNELFLFSVEKGMNNNKQDIIKKLKSRFTVYKRDNKFTPIAERYLKDIKKIEKLRPSQIEIKDKIDEILDLD